MRVMMLMIMLMVVMVFMCMVMVVSMLMCVVMMTGSDGMLFEIGKTVFDGVADPLDPVRHAGAVL